MESKRFLIGDGDKEVTLLRLGRGAAVGLDTCRSVTDGTRIYQSAGRLNEVGIGQSIVATCAWPGAAGRTGSAALLRNAQQVSSVARSQPFRGEDDRVVDLGR